MEWDKDGTGHTIVLQSFYSSKNMDSLSHLTATAELFAI